MDPLTFQPGKTNTEDKTASGAAPAVPSAASDPITPDLNPLATEPVETPPQEPVAPGPVSSTPNPDLKVVPAPPVAGQDPQAPVATTNVPAPSLPKGKNMMMYVGIAIVVFAVLVGLVYLLA